MALRRLLPKVLSSNVLVTNLPVRQHVSEAVWNMPSAVRGCSSVARRPLFFRSSIVLAGTLGLGVYLGSNFVDPDQLKLAYLIPVRLGRDIYTAGAIIIGTRAIILFSLASNFSNLVVMYDRQGSILSQSMLECNALNTFHAAHTMVCILQQHRVELRLCCTKTWESIHT
jgi:hypothetical protein